MNCMHDLQRARDESISAAQDVLSLMKAIQVLLAICEGRVNAFWSHAEGGREGTLLKMAHEIERHFVLAGELGLVAVATATPIRQKIEAVLTKPQHEDRSEGAEQRLRAECAQALETLATLMSTLEIIGQRMVASLESLRDAAVHRGVGSDVRSTFDALLERVRRPPNQKQGD